MAIKRATRKTDFTMISNVGIKDEKMSAKAKGALAYMLSLPDDWVFYETELTNHFTDGRASIRVALKELETNGYLVREQGRASGGRFGTSDWTVYDEPLFDSRSSVKPTSVKPTSDNHTLLSTKGTKDLSILNTNNKKTLSDKSNDTVYQDVIEHLNEKTSSNFRWKSKGTQKHINGRLSEGFTLDDFMYVIDVKVQQWYETGEKIRETDAQVYLRPNTLFSATNFESYLNQPMKQKHENDLSDEEIDSLPF